MDRQSLKERFGIIGNSVGVRHALDRVRLVAGTEITVLIQGESGVGKELFAQAIHELSERRHKSMLIMNCGAIPEGLIESELFGNEKGAYTGAVEQRQGYFEKADKSTIFLDEIAEMPLTAQVRLLRVIETGEYSRVGSSNLLRSDVRVIAATNKDLAREVETGRFREDLYYRLSTVILQVPSLRERREDILPIFEHFQYRFAQKYNRSAPRLDLASRELLLRYRWPGNIRELKNVAEQTVVLLRGDSVTAEDLRPYLRGVSSGGSGMGLVQMSDAGSSQGEPAGARERELIYRALLEMRVEFRDLKNQIAKLVDGASTAVKVDPAAVHDSSHLLVRHEEPGDRESFIEEAPYEIETGNEYAQESYEEHELQTLEKAERTLILRALKRFEGNRRQTAEALGISERTLYRKLKEIEAEEQTSK